jgi:hypothetical protein
MGGVGARTKRASTAVAFMRAEEYVPGGAVDRSERGAPRLRRKRGESVVRLFRVLAVLVLLAVGVPAAVHSATGPSRASHGRDTLPLLPPLKRQGSPEAVVAEHLAALNACDWNRLMAQYPPSVHFFLPGGMVVIGRQAVGELFLGFCKSRAEGGNLGLIFTPQQTFKVGKTINTQWSAEASFLTEPYLGADAYVTKGGLMYAQVTTFGAPPLPYK